jgi:hypothetical protein
VAVVFKRVGGRKLTKIIALQSEVQTELTQQALAHGVEAEALLNARADVRTGTSNIEIEVGNVDRYVVLSDERGQSAAMTIEFGRQPAPNNKGHAGLRILRDTFGI